MRRLRNVKIVATLGPASSSYAMIRALHEAGADVQPDDRFLSSEDAHPSPSREGKRTEFRENLDVRLHQKVEACQ